jgi:uncharacterized protein YjiS (DUF1127 family)
MPISFAHLPHLRNSFPFSLAQGQFQNIENRRLEMHKLKASEMSTFSSLANPMGMAKRCRSAFADWQSARRTQKILSGLSDKILYDIGEQDIKPGIVREPGKISLEATLSDFRTYF